MEFFFACINCSAIQLPDEGYPPYQQGILFSVRQPVRTLRKSVTSRAADVTMCAECTPTSDDDVLYVRQFK